MLALLCFVLLPYFLRIKINIRIGLFKTEFDWVRSGGRCPGTNIPHSQILDGAGRSRGGGRYHHGRRTGCAGRAGGTRLARCSQHCGLRRDVGRSVGSDRAHRSCLFLSRQDGSAAAAGQAGNSRGGRRMRDICPSPGHLSPPKVTAVTDISSYLTPTLRLNPNTNSVLNKSLFSFLRQLSTRHCSHLLPSVAAAVRRAAAPRPAAWLPLSIDVSRRHGAQQQTRHIGVRRVNDGTDRQTDRQTPDRFIDPAAHTMRAVSIS